MFRGPAYYNPYLPSYGPYIDPERARAIAARRAKRAQWLPDEIDDFDDDYEYNQLGPQERAWVNAHQNQAAVERERQRRLQEELQKRAEEEQRWQQQLDKRQKEDQETRRKFEEERERRRRVQLQQQQAQRGQGHSQSRSRSRGPQPQASPKSSPTPPTPVPQYEQKHVDAASKLQRRFRIRQSFRIIKSLSSQFHTLRKEFTDPSTLSFQNPSSPPNSTDVINVPVVSPSEQVDSAAPKEDESMDVDNDSNIPKLAFNSTNYALHSYLDSLDKLLIKLDGIGSWGDQNVRVKRRAVIKQIEEEQARLDKMLKDSWIKYVQTEGKA